MMMPLRLDVVVVEGYKDEPDLRGVKTVRLEVVRADISLTMMCTADRLSAVVSDDELPGSPSVPRFAPSDAKGIADLIEEQFDDA
jgi:molybdopterin-guanine dinucleotide biosynthesis protein